MPYETMFSLAVSVASPMRVPEGTIARIEEQIAATEQALGFEREKYRDNPERWMSHNVSRDIDDRKACEAVAKHNQFVVWLFRRMEAWGKSPPDKDAEVLTVERSAELFPFLVQIRLSPDRWSGDFYQERMDEFYEVMRGRATNGISFGAKSLTPQQADAVVTLFAEHLDLHDIRLAVPKGRDYLARSDDGGYSWCEKCCAAIAECDIGSCGKRRCPLAEDID